MYKSFESRQDPKTVPTTKSATLKVINQGFIQGEWIWRLYCLTDLKSQERAL